MLSVQSRTGHQHFQVWSEPADVFDETKEDVGVQGSLVGLVYDEHTGRREADMSVKLALKQSNNRVTEKAVETMSNFIQFQFPLEGKRGYTVDTVKELPTLKHCD